MKPSKFKQMKIMNLTLLTVVDLCDWAPALQKMTPLHQWYSEMGMLLHEQASKNPNLMDRKTS